MSFLKTPAWPCPAFVRCYGPTLSLEAGRDVLRGASRSRWLNPDCPGSSFLPLPSAKLPTFCVDPGIRYPEACGSLAGSQTLREGPLMLELKDLSLN